MEINDGQMKGTGRFTRWCLDSVARCCPSFDARLWECQYHVGTGEVSGRHDHAFFLSDLLLFACLVVWVTGIVIAVASLLS